MSTSGRRASKGDLRRALDALRAEGAARRREHRDELEALLAVVREARHDGRRVVDAGRVLERIARERLHARAGYDTMHAMLAEHAGISRTTAHRWRAIARAVERGELDAPEATSVALAYDAVRPGSKRKSPPIEAAARRRVARVVRALRARGAGEVSATFERRDDRLFVCVVLPFDALDALEL